MLIAAPSSEAQRKDREMSRERWRIVCVYFRVHYVHFFTLA